MIKARALKTPWAIVTHYDDRTNLTVHILEWQGKALLTLDDEDVVKLEWLFHAAKARTV